MTSIHTGYIITEDGSIYTQIPADNGHGFEIADDDQSWPGGLGIGSDWTAIADDDERITDDDRDRLGWIIDDARSA